ncbi:MAG TPA: penicillin acylase family protein [Candidatus Paceibacterota bacterium]|nr:penicillin acylase family protein [Candidatus Paceibacterota bacterium]
MSTAWRRLVTASAMALVVVSTKAAQDYGKVELLRDRWGIPHVFSDTDEGAMYGLGFATAQERGFQMTYGLRLMQGRLAEILGDRPRGGRKETALDNDRRMRTFGWTRAASRIAAKLDPGTRGLLEAYCEGVNASFAAQQTTDTLHPLFKQLDVAPEKWTPADCLLSWWHVAQYFAGDGTRDLMVWRNRTQPPPGAPAIPMPSASWVDDTAAVVQREDVSQEWLREVERFCATVGLSAGGSGGATNDPPKFSHAWVVGGKRTTTGSAVLVSDPQTPVRNPSLWMEFHVKGKTFDARGVGMPGSPGLLIGFNRRVAWGLTALGADQADLFRLETSVEHPDAYRWNGQWCPMEVHTETILVKGGAPTTLTIRDTHLGPVVSEFAFRQPGDPEVALKRVPVCETNHDTIQGVFAMMRASDAKAFHQALPDWRFPSANCVYGDADGHIGYSVLGAIPVRAPSSGEARGGEALPGTGDADDWRGFVPAALVPQVEGPRLGFLLSANHRPIASFYPVGLGTSTGSMGDTIRSWRLRERLSGRERFSPADVREVHYDTVNPARREIVRLGLHLRATQPEVLSEASLKALAALEKWLAAGASSDLRSEHADLATRLSTFFRFVVTPLARKYGGGESGLARFLKDASSRISKDPKATFESDECRFIDRVLSEAWSAGGAAGRNGARAQATRVGAPKPPLGWFDSLDGFGSLDPAQDVATPGITCLDGQTIHCQSAQSYTQWVPLHDVDLAETVCPIGHSDRPDSRYRRSTMELWATAKLHPAPLSRQVVERITVERATLRPGTVPSSASAPPEHDLPASSSAPLDLPRVWEKHKSGKEYGQFQWRIGMLTAVPREGPLR